MPDYFHFPELPDRAVRSVSFEAETTANSYDLAYAIGVRSASYHSGSGRHSGRPSVYIEEDGSCGAEVIYSMMPLQTAQGAQEVQGYWDNVKAFGARVNSSCGFHVHVDPTPCDFSAIQSLYHLWNGLEDPLYRIAGAGHRNGHRGTAYCPVTPKQLTGAVDVGGGMAGGRFGLNLSRVLRSMLQCSCGAVRYGAWSECSCGNDAGTVEFRVWNGTLNARKAHAYIALSLGLVAESQRIRYDRKRVGELPWTGRESHAPTGSRMRKAVERILSLPMSAFDRECVLYCVRNSSIPGVIGSEGMRTLSDRYGAAPVTPTTEEED